jgi:hypothetical protein
MRIVSEVGTEWSYLTDWVQSGANPTPEALGLTTLDKERLRDFKERLELADT